MTKYLSKEGLNLYDSLIKEHIDIKLQNTIDLLAYGVEWDTEIADPHLTRIGNMTFHKTLPIQSQMKPCIAQGNKIIYYLNPLDLRFKKYGELTQVTTTIDTSGNIDPQPVTIVHDNFSTTKYLNQYIRIKSYKEEFDYAELKFKIVDIDTTTKTAKLDWKTNEPDHNGETWEAEFGAILSGYDGTVAVEVPEFYIKSFIEGTKRRVYISTIKIDDTWYHQKKCLVDSFRCTVLNTVPEDMGYLSTLPVKSAISVVNTESYCRGGGNRTAFDDYLNTDPFRTDLGKPRTNINRPTMRTYARNAGKEIMSYIQYKNILYWLWVIEYANFNSQETYKEELTETGYRQGGMGPGVTTVNSWNNWTYYNNNCPLTPNGYTYFDFYSNTGVKPAQIKTPTVSGGDPTQTYNLSIPIWRGIENPFGDIYTNLDGVIIQGDAEGNPKKVYVTDNPNDYGDDEIAKSKMRIAGYQIDQDGWIKEFDLGEEANIISNAVGASTSTYKCDRQYAGSKNAILKTLFVGGLAGSSGGIAGLSCFDSSYGVNSDLDDIGYRLIKEID